MVHKSFTGSVGNMDESYMGSHLLLYIPKRKSEKETCVIFGLEVLEEEVPPLFPGVRPQILGFQNVMFFYAYTRSQATFLLMLILLWWWGEGG